MRITVSTTLPKPPAALKTALLIAIVLLLSIGAMLSAKSLLIGVLDIPAMLAAALLSIFVIQLGAFVQSAFFPNL